MMNSKELVGITECLAALSRYRTNRCLYNRVLLQLTNTCTIFVFTQLYCIKSLRNSTYFDPYQDHHHGIRTAGAVPCLLLSHKY
jgi:hypothetical protein